MAMQSSKEIPQEEFTAMAKALRTYLPDASDYEELDDMRAVRLLQQKG